MISLITVTARRDPMFREMLESLKTACAQVSATLIEWVIVDAGLWWDPGGVRAEALVLHPSSSFPWIRHIPPKPSAYHGPLVTTTQLPDPNGARNTGLVYARGQYLVFIDDCSVVHPNFLQRVVKAKEENRIVRFQHAYQNGFAMSPTPASEEPYLRIGETSLRGSAVGYPIKALLEVNGFDEAYSGCGKEDIEIGIRLARRKWELWEDRNTWVIEHRCQELLFPTIPTFKNEALLDRLSVDTDRYLPYGPQPDFTMLRERIRSWRRPK